MRNQDGEWVTCSGGKERVECQGATKNILRAHHPVVKSRLGFQGSDPPKAVAGRESFSEGGGVAGTPYL